MLLYPAFALTAPCPFCTSAPNHALRPTKPLRRMRLPPRPMPARIHIRASNMGPLNPSGTPDGRIIANALESSFRSVWIRLMTSGIGEEYQQAIQAFVVACVAAYKAGYSLTALKMELAANEATTKYMGRDITLNDQEKETRVIWIALVYLTLARFGFVSEKTPPRVSQDLQGTAMEPLVPGLTGLVESVCDAAEKGYTLQTFKMELTLKSDADSKPMSSGEASIRSQWSRIVFATYYVLPDALKRKRR